MQEAKAPKASTSAAAAVPTADSPDDMFATGWLSRLHKPGGNEQKYPERMKEHLAWTGGKVFTRFPPEPNGFLHVSRLDRSPVMTARLNAASFPQIGHSKAIAVNFGYAKYHKGHCYLRYDDTNPEAEEQIYFDKILENIRWLGYEPYQITHSSDHFQELYELAVLLIKKGLAYTSNDTGASPFLSCCNSGPEPILRLMSPRSRRDLGPARRQGPRPAARLEGPRQADRAVASRVRRHEGGQVPAGRDGPPHEAGHGELEPDHVGHYRIPRLEQAASPDRLRVVHLPDL